MNRDKLRVAGYVVLIVRMVLLVIFFDDIKAVFNEMMMEQTGSLVDQLFR